MDSDISDINDNNAENLKSDIKDTLTCFICTAKIIDPMMCPQCKKLVCSKCIKKWFVDQNHEKCPFCQFPLSYDKMINLPFMNFLSDYFIKEIENKECERHQKTFISVNNNMNLNQIIDSDDDDNNNNININNNSNGKNNLYNSVMNVNFNNKDNENDFLAKTSIFPSKFQKNDEYNDNINLNFNSNNIAMGGGMGVPQKINMNNMCQKHKKEIIEYYCLNCNTQHCAKCLMITNKESKKHQNHKIIDIEKKNKYNIDELLSQVNSLSDVNKELNQYKINYEIENKILEKKEEFFKKMAEELELRFSNRLKTKKENLLMNIERIDNQLKKIDGIKYSHKDALMNFVEREDQKGFNEYLLKVEDFKKTENYVHNDNYGVYLNPSLKFFETDFFEIDIMENEEILAEYKFTIDGLKKQLHFRFNQDAIDEVLINLQIIGDKDEIWDQNNITYFSYIVLKNKNCITSANLNERMFHDGVLILGKTIVKNSLKNIVDDNNKCHVKIVLCELKI